MPKYFMKRVIIGLMLGIFLIGMIGIISAVEICAKDSDCVLKNTPYCCGNKTEYANGCYHINETLKELNCTSTSPCPGIAAINSCECEDNKCVGKETRNEKNETEEDDKNNSIELRKEIKDNKKKLKEDIKELRKNVKELIKERKGEYKFKGERGNIIIREISDDKKEIIVEKINARTGLNLTVEDLNNETGLGAWLSNGRHAIIKFMPDKASERAIERLKLKVCNESNNCIIELKEVGIGNKTRIAYEISAEENSKVLFIFKNKMKVVAQVDGETGEIISVKKPWWSFLASKSD